MQGDTPQPADNPHWPSWFYPPETDPDDPGAHGRIFTCAEDVPEGWLVDWRLHGSNLNREPPAASEIALSRDELRAELTKRDIPWVTRDGKAELWRLLKEALDAEAMDASV